MFSPSSPVDAAREAQLAACTSVLAGDAMQSDLGSAWSGRSLEALRGAGLLSMALPLQHGGGGADAASCALVAAELGRHCATTAVAFCSHAAPLLWMAAGGEAAQQALHAPRIQQGLLYAQALSDAGESVPGRRPPGVLARKVEGGYRLHGRKPGVPLAGIADHHLLLCTLDRPGATPRDTLLLAVSAGLPGTAVDRSHPPMGLRGLALGDLVLQDVFVPDAETLLPVGAAASVAWRRPDLLLLLLAPLMGIAQGAYDATLGCLRGAAARHGTGLPALPRAGSHVHHTVARMKLLLEQARALWMSAVLGASADPDPEARQALLAACHTVADHCLALCGMALQACGLPGQERGMPLERLLRDAHSLCAWLPWSLEGSLEQLGRECLAPDKDAREPDVL